jgi:hypothetical protein
MKVKKKTTQEKLAKCKELMLIGIPLKPVLSTWPYILSTHASCYDCFT